MIYDDDLVGGALLVLVLLMFLFVFWYLNGWLGRPSGYPSKVQVEVPTVSVNVKQDPGVGFKSE